MMERKTRIKKRATITSILLCVAWGLYVLIITSSFQQNTDRLIIDLMITFGVGIIFYFIPWGIGRLIIYGISRKTIIITGFVFIVIATLIPPWKKVVKINAMYSENPIGYSLIFLPPYPENNHASIGISIDVTRMFIEWIIIASCTYIGIFLLEKKKEYKNNDIVNS